MYLHQLVRLGVGDGGFLKIWAMSADPYLIKTIVCQKWKPEQEILSNPAKSKDSQEQP
jgi:hypothetical protein